jgi:hypothetical protein
VAQHKANVANTKDSNGKGKKVVKSYHQGAVPKNKHDVAKQTVAKKYNASTKKSPKVGK